jgi:hypothetical protein
MYANLYLGKFCLHQTNSTKRYFFIFAKNLAR